MTRLEPKEQARKLQWESGLASSALVLMASLVATPYLGIDFILNIAIGACILNFAVGLTMRSVLVMFAAAQSTSEADSGRAALGFLRLLHWSFLALALALILWYMPARPEGLALGVVFGLIALTFASYRVRSHQTLDETPPQEPPRAS